MKEIERVNPTKKAYSRKNKTINYQVMPKTEEIALVEGILAEKPEEEKEATPEEIEGALVYSNDVTSIDFLMPEDERAILEKNLNIYEDQKKIQETLSIAKKNKKLSEDIKSLDFISKEGELGTKLLDVMTDDQSVEVLLKSFKEKMEKGESGKAYKELATAYKIIMDARQEKIKQLNTQRSGKASRIALKFQNDSGEEIQLGVEI